MALLVLVAALAGPVHADSADQAKRMYDRIAGVPPDADTLASMVSAIDAGDARAAAALALDAPEFYDITLKNMATPWTNRERTVFAPLNDYSATFIGLVRDGADIRTLLTTSVLYAATDTPGLPPYSNTSNAHYEALAASSASLKDALRAVDQTTLTGLPADAVSGVLTSRAAAQAFFIAGTNRAMFRYTLLNHLCVDLEQIKDTSRPPDRIRQDVSRSPGGDARLFLNNCVGCHSGMDPMAQAFAYYEFDHAADDPEGASGQLSWNGPGQIDAETGTRVQAKYHINATSFPPGFVTPDDSWANYWREGQNVTLGWDPALPGNGSGARTMAMELSHSDAYASCQVTKVFQAVCLRPPVDAADRAQIDAMTTALAADNYDLRTSFVDAAVYCRGE